MTLSFFTDKKNPIQGRKARLGGASLAALALLGLPLTASADTAVETPPEGFKAADSIKDFEAVTLLADGSAEVVLETGETVLFTSSEVSLVGGQVFIAETAIAAAGLSGTGAGIGTLAIIGAGVLGGAGLAVAGSKGEDNAAPTITSSSTISIAENDTAAFNASATDTDNDSLTYSLSGADAGLFTINSSTGEVTFVGAPDFEAPDDAGGNNVYDVILTVSDGSVTTTQNVAITVTNVNEAPVITSAVSATVGENINAATAVYTATATDIDGDTLTYSLTGADAALFAVDAATGVVTFVASPDFEAPSDADGDNVYDITVNASDGSLSTTQDISVTITDVNEAPVITSASSVFASENQMGAFTAAATDVDGDALSYSLTGADASLFAVDAATGVVTFANSPDFEVPADSDADNVYDVTLNVSDGSITTTQTVAISVTDVNEAPTITSSAAVSVDEGQLAAFTAVAADVDGDTLTYSLSGEDASLFTINSTNGAVRFVSVPDFENPADVGGDNVYNVTVIVSDGTNSTSQVVQISVADTTEIAVSGSVENDTINLSTQTERAVVDAGDGNDSVATGSGDDTLDGGDGDDEIASGAGADTIEGGAGNDIIYAGSGADSVAAGAGDDIVVIIGQTNAGEYTQQNLINPSGTGVDISGVASISDVNSNAQDDAAAGESLSGGDGLDTVVVYGQTVLSNVNLQGFERLVLNSDVTLSGSQAEAFENGIGIQGDGTSILRIVNTDSVSDITLSNVSGIAFLEIGEGVSVTLSVAELNSLIASGLDAIGGAGQLIIGDPAGLDLSGLTIESDLQLIEGTTNAIIDPAAFGATVVSDNIDPVILQSGDSASFAENSSANVYTAVAIDSDDDALTYSLSGTDAALFAIDSVTGIVTFISAPNFEAATDSDGNSIYDINVSASDGLNSTTQAVAITVTDVNEAPVITSGATASSAENISTATAVYTATASDVDGDTLAYTLTGTDAALFAVDAATGVVTFVASADFETPADAGADNVYDVTLNISDGNITTTQDVAITVTDVNEAPIISSGASASTAENIVTTTAVYVATASDGDGDTLTYTLTGADADLFAVDAATGVVTFVASPDFETPGDAGADNVYDVTLNVSDGDITTTQAVSITVTDVNEAPVISSGVSATVVENTGTVAYTATASDVDGDTLTYSLTGADADLFAVDAATGVVTFVASPDFEAPADTRADNVYDVTLNVSDGNITTTQDVAITVRDVNEAPIISSGASASTAENIGTTTAVYVATASDVDGDTLTYSLTGADAAFFAVETATGVVTFAASPDFETPSDADADNVYDVILNVSDGDITTAQDVAIAVTNVNEAPVISSGVSATVVENIGMAAYTATASDVDGDTLTYSLTGADAALFAIDATTGVVTFAASPDFETPGDAGADNVYDVTLNVSDGNISTTQDIAITVTDVNEAPVITSSVSPSVVENTFTETAVYTATATDVDGDALTYSLTGADAALFAVDTATGVVTFAASPDFEVPLDAGADNVYDLTLNVSDGDIVTTQAVEITVTDVDDTAPVAPTILSVGMVNAFVPQGDAGDGVFQFLPAITGIAEAGSTVEIFDGDISLGTTIAQSDGSFFYAAALTSLSGALISATATDAAGNTSELASLAQQFGFNPAEYFQENPGPLLAAQDINADTGFIITAADGDLRAPLVSNAGDVNNDGYDDLLIGSLYSDIRGEFSGQVAVIFGGEDGFGTLVAGTPIVNIETLLPEDGFIIAGADSLDFLRSSSSIGDFNGDGIDDIVVGANRADIGGPGAGASYIIFGGETEFGVADDGGRQVLDLANLSAEDGIIFTRNTDVGQVGTRVSDAGDVNGDGISDLLIGDTSFNGVGAGFIVFGTSGSLGETDENGQQIVDLDALSPDQAFVITGGDDANFLGFGIDTLGDVNGDGIDDFIISDPSLTGSVGELYAGEAYIVFGRLDGVGTLDENGTSVLNVSELTSDQGVTIIGDYFDPLSVGISVAGIGDFNGDGYNDVLIGASDSNGGGEGQAYVLYGREDGIGTDDGSGGLIVDLSTLTADDGVILEGGFNSFAGYSVAGLGDFNSDGFDDIVVGAPGFGSSNGDTGFAHVIYGGQSVGSINDDGQRVINLDDFGALSGFSIRGEGDNDDVGASVSSAGDINGDGIPDLILSSNGSYSVSNPGRVGQEPAMVFFGGRTRGESETLALVEENTTAAFVATSLGEGTSYVLSGDDAALFTINQVTGLVSFIEAPDFEEIFTTESLSDIIATLDDAEGLEDFGFDLEVTATNGDLSAVQEVAITVTDVNEFAPVFETTDTLLSSNGSFWVTASDADGTPVGLAGTISNPFIGDVPRFDDALTYEIVGGADVALFNIESTNGPFSGFFGLLTFNEMPALDAPVDADGDGFYDVIVMASDGEFSTTQTLSLSLVEAGDVPVFTGQTNFDINELDNETTFQVTAEDPEGADIIYLLGDSVDDVFFDIDSFTGIISFINPPSFNRPRDSGFDNTYDVTVLAFDGTNYESQLITINVNDVEFAPTITSNTDVSTQENLDLSAFFLVGDVDDGDLTASITGGADGGLFALEFGLSSFGGGQFFILRLDQTLDFEMPIDADGDNIFEVEVTLSDGVNETLEFITISVLDIFESPNAPIFTSSDTITVDEGQRFVINVSANDADGEALVYFITGGEDQSDFTLDPVTGELNFGFPERFNQPDDASDNFYTVEVTADDGTSNRVTQTITVEVTDVEFAPTLTVPLAPTVVENNIIFLTVSATEDFDDQTLTISIQGEDAALFSYNSFGESAGFTRGQISLIDFPDFEMPADADGDNVYNLEVVATDGVNTVIETLSLTVLDFYESPNAPIFVSSDTAVVNEGEAAILTVSATDSDGEMPTYNLTGGSDRFIFSIDNQTGELSFSRLPTFNEPGRSADNFYTVEVTADDGSSNRTTQSITVEILDANVPPVIDASAEYYVNENQTYVDFIGARDIADQDVVTLSLRGTDAAFFEVTNTTPSIYISSQLNFLIAPDFENPLDANGDNIYELELVSSDGVNETIQAVSITIRDLFESENAPVFISPSEVAVNEAEIFIQTIVAEDADGETPLYFITGGDDPNVFNLNIFTGELSFTSGRLFQEPGGFRDNFYSVEITADDGSSNRTVQTIVVEVLDVNLPPIISWIPQNIFVDENTQFTQFISVSDNRDNENVTTFLRGEDSAYFTLTSSGEGIGYTNRLSFTSLPDFEMPTDENGDNVYTFEVVASDGVNETIGTVNVTVRDVLESTNAPVFSSPDTVMVNEGENFVVVLDATDADGDDVTFNIIGGADQSSFFIIRLNELVFVSQPLFRTPTDANQDGIYEVLVGASDGANVTTQLMSITVNDINSPPVVFFSSIAYSQTEGNTDVFHRFEAGDRIDDELVTFTLAGVDAAFFTLDASYSGIALNGRFRFTEAPDFENPLDADGDNVYEVDVVVTDGVNDVIQSVTITVEDDTNEAQVAAAVDPESSETELDQALASFNVIDDEVINLGETSMIEAADIALLRQHTSSFPNDPVSDELPDFDVQAEMQFAADLMLLHDGGAFGDA